VGVAVGADSAISGVGAEMPEHPASKKAAAISQTAVTAGEGPKRLRVTMRRPSTTRGIHAGQKARPIESGAWRESTRRAMGYGP
jgi:hypothetical protein